MIENLLTYYSSSNVKKVYNHSKITSLAPDKTQRPFIFFFKSRNIKLLPRSDLNHFKSKVNIMLTNEQEKHFHENQE